MEPTSIRNYAILFAIVAISSYFGNQIQKYYQDVDKDEEYELIRKFLLNDAESTSTFQDRKKPKLWIHTTYNINARQWKSFYSRNSTELNQPYIHLTIQSIVQHCGDNFHICLIDDESFSKLIPSWSFSLSSVPEPFRQRMREYGLSTLLYMYGGMVVPNSFICFRNLMSMYQEGMASNHPFVCEKVSHIEGFKRHGKRLMFSPDPYFMGCKSGDPVMATYMEYLRKRNMDQHFQAQTDFLGDSAQWLLALVEAGDMNLLDGTNVGVKTTQRTKIGLEDLMEEDLLDLSPGCYGVYIPADEVLSRIKYQWLASISVDELFHSSNAVLVQYLRQATFAMDVLSTKKRGSVSGPGYGDDMEVEVVEIKYMVPSIGGL